MLDFPKLFELFEFETIQITCIEFFFLKGTKKPGLDVQSHVQLRCKKKKKEELSCLNGCPCILQLKCI